MSRSRGVAAAVVGLLAIAVSGCASLPRNGSSASPCTPSRRTTVLATTLVRLVPSPSFTVAAHATAWVSTDSPPDSEQLFAGAGGVARVAVVADSDQPDITTDSRGFQQAGDPAVNLRKPGRWERLPVGAGVWRLYTATLGTALPVAVVTCPA